MPLHTRSFGTEVPQEDAGASVGVILSLRRIRRAADLFSAGICLCTRDPSGLKSLRMTPVKATQLFEELVTLGHKLLKISRLVARPPYLKISFRNAGIIVGRARGRR